MIREISIKDIEEVSLGHATNEEAKTGVSVSSTGLSVMQQAIVKAVERRLRMKSI